MPIIERILISELPSDAVWRQLRLKFVEFDVEEESEDDNVYDLRQDDDMLKDVVLFWGRDGWSNGYWQARITLTRCPERKTLLVYATRGDHPDCMPLMAIRKMLLLFMSSCMSAREHNPTATNE